MVLHYTSAPSMPPNALGLHMSAPPASTSLSFSGAVSNTNSYGVLPLVGAGHHMYRGPPPCAARHPRGAPITCCQHHLSDPLPGKSLASSSGHSYTVTATTVTIDPTHSPPGRSETAALIHTTGSCEEEPSLTIEPLGYSQESVMSTRPNGSSPPAESLTAATPTTAYTHEA
ncbi:unnamed protein product [Protopolystoma xenopodis]|uniref:Uncharacterized protein n=1 Tax=Protopolystoma xenopodis TaxID=117903 RepID=A0A3S5A1L6_9PLAT|nr:unnamed protein product [Protopolystoma xenopodis]